MGSPCCSCPGSCSIHAQPFLTLLHHATRRPSLPPPTRHTDAVADLARPIGDEQAAADLEAIRSMPELAAVYHVRG